MSMLSMWYSIYISLVWCSYYSGCYEASGVLLFVCTLYSLMMDIVDFVIKMSEGEGHFEFFDDSKLVWD